MKTWKFKPQFAGRKRKNDVDNNCHVTNAKTNSWDNFITDESVLQRLSIEAQQLWNAHGGDKSKAKSFWTLKEDTPKCLLEKFALQVGNFHAYNNSGDEDAFIGVEFWVQLRQGSYNDAGTEHGLEFHFDKDEILAKTEDKWHHPTYSTVTYLPTFPVSSDMALNKHAPKQAGGLPLVVFATESVEEGDKGPKHPQLFPQCAWVVHPQPNRHVMFNGNLLHGCPSDLIRPILASLGDAVSAVGANNMSYSRLALAVNVWTRHEPADLHRLNLATLSAVSQNKVGTKGANVLSQGRIGDIQIDATDVTHIKKVKCDSEMSMDNLHFVKEHREGDTAPLPLQEIATEFRKFVQGTGESAVLAVKYTAN